MPTFLRIMEILSCSMAGFLPYLLLLIYPFRNHLRLKSFLAGLLTLVMTPALLYHDILSALGTAPIAMAFPLLRSAAFLVFALLVIHAHPGKVLLNTLSVINLSILISAVADRFAAAYTLQHLLITLALQALLLIPYTLNLINCLAPTLNSSDASVWNLLWIAPAVGTALGCILLSTGAQALFPVMAAAIILAAAASALILHTTRTEMITLILKKEKPAKTAQAAPAAQLQHDPVQTYLTNLQARMAEAEYSYKELLLQVMTMEDDLNHEDFDQLRARLSAMRKQLAPDVASTGNNRIDPIVAYYTRQAMLSNIKTVTNLTLPEWSSVSDEDMSVLIGCLMEYALYIIQCEAVPLARLHCLHFLCLTFKNREFSLPAYTLLGIKIVLLQKQKAHR